MKRVSIHCKVTSGCSHQPTCFFGLLRNHEFCYFHPSYTKTSELLPRTVTAPPFVMGSSPGLHSNEQTMSFLPKVYGINMVIVIVPILSWASGRNAWISRKHRCLRLDEQNPLRWFFMVSKHAQQ